jgi:hypothetical protein
LISPESLQFQIPPDDLRLKPLRRREIFGLPANKRLMGKYFIPRFAHLGCNPVDSTVQQILKRKSTGEAPGLIGFRAGPDRTPDIPIDMGPVRLARLSNVHS